MKEGCLILFCVIILLSGCIQQSEIDSSITGLEQENSELKEDVKELETQITSLKNELNTITEERDHYLKELDDFYLTKITGTIDLTDWDNDHIIRALGYYNDKFNSAVWQNYAYRRAEKDFYWTVNNSLGFISDPFFELRRGDRGTELDFFHFRIERLDLTDNKTLAQIVYGSYVGDVFAETQIDSELKCYEQTVCRDVKVIKCTKDNKDYYSWFEGLYLFTTRFDNREALDAFEKFYCHTDPYASLL